ncbi:RNA-directed DNA polymerase [Sporosarcina thermotolerans]|uniref:RNA-directed DNA polymerase n=2 Tax=Sporosarcina thermotolerans TaxID=633404 RepID=A0AAW9ACC4_9BACL|nr:RNA-directed DNA polymerase [Sporosarcina thermotolerans]MDW0118610.1 RNA-directed DNA polymerase [Sporosarcina thermotolerans]
MSMIMQKYIDLSPTADFLTDKVILSQAWKKSNSYIRRANWYADILELDKTTIQIERLLGEWGSSLNDDFTTHPLKCIPAPKNQEWHFVKMPSDSQELWKIKDKDSKKDESDYLRPLAHVSIRDQTLSTAVMMTMANLIETAQGFSEEQDFLKAQKKNVYSYGNRLHCNWTTDQEEKDIAIFSWGNSKTYRQYFEDYKLFLKRPRQICEFYSSLGTSDEELYIITFDIKSFFTVIDTDALVNILHKIAEEANMQFDKDLVSKIFTWKWENTNGTVTEQSLGLPQGLVASGFLSNAYLLNFDISIGEMINNDELNANLKIRDYCRYVDDLSFVVESSEEADYLKKLLREIISDKLLAHVKNIGTTKELELNDKVTITNYAQASTLSSLSIIMEDTQRAISVTPTVESLKSAFDSLQSLLELSLQLTPNSEVHNELELSFISKPKLDVRDDTMQRFVATRMDKVLRMQQSMVTELKPAQQDHEFEATARRLIACWAKNPSLHNLLKIALDLYPDPKLLVPVLDAIRLKLNNKKGIPDSENYVAKYIAADLLFAAARYLGKNSRSYYPLKADVNDFQEELAVFAKEVLDNHEDCWYMAQSAVIYLISVGHNDINLKNEDKMIEYKCLIDCANYRIPSTNTTSIHDQLSMALIIQHIKSSPKRFNSWFVKWINNIEEEFHEEIYNLLLITDANMLHNLYTSIQSKRLLIKIDNIMSKSATTFLKNLSKKEINLVRNKPISLLRVIMSDNNPFEQENALLLLIKELLQPKNIKAIQDGAGVIDFNISCTDWRNINNLESNIKIELGNDKFTIEKSIPEWVPKERMWIYSLGKILRSCLTGEYDYTTTQFLIQEEQDSYRGIRSTSYTRRFGINNMPKGLFDDHFPVTPWLSELLLKLLQWPGIELIDRSISQASIETAASLNKLINKRIKFQREIFGKLSNTPSYVIPVNSDPDKAGDSLKIAIAQTLFPKITDINTKDPENWSKNDRKTHRRHLAAMCNLIRAQASTTNLTDNEITKNKIDLIIFPELSIHLDDLDLLESLSQETGACIFAGLTFISDKKSGELRNQALWLLRDDRKSGRQFNYIYQGKANVTEAESQMNIKGHRPYQILIEMTDGNNNKIRISGAICYDATDLALVSDLRDISDIFVVSALNKDIQTFDNMVAALQYHMYQPVILANSGEFGGSTAQAPYTKHNNIIAHLHGNQQVGISIFDLDASSFKTIKSRKLSMEVKTHPAGYKGRLWDMT